jgi:hypothetical protein
MIIPEFGRNRHLPEVDVRVFFAQCRYDTILGRDILHHFRLVLDFDSDTVIGPDAAQPMRCFPLTFLDPQRTVAQELELDSMDIHLADHTFSSNDDAFAPAPASDNESSIDFPESLSSNPVILPSQYEQADLPQVVQNSKHLTPQQHQQLHRVLSKHSKLFDGTLGRYPGESIHLDVDPSVPPHRSRAYPVPNSHMKLFKDELVRLISLGVLESQRPIRVDPRQLSHIEKRRDSSLDFSLQSSQQSS